MKKNVGLFVGLVSLVLIVATGCGPGSLVPPTTEPATQALEPTTEESGQATQEPTETGGEPTDEAGSGLPVFRLVPEETEARFLIDEILANQPKTVVGTTNAVEGSLVPDFDTPSNTTVGLVRVDMSTLITDSEFRNRAIHTAILQTGDEGFRYADFETTSLTGLPEKVVIGEPFSFQIVGNMSIHGVSKELTFDATATAVSETRIEGTATTQPILYADFGINILRLPPQVASVEDDLVLELEFVAVAE